MLHSLKYLRVRTKVAKIQGDQKNRGLEFFSPFNHMKLLKTVPQHIVFNFRILSKFLSSNPSYVGFSKISLLTLVYQNCLRNRTLLRETLKKIAEIPVP